MTVREPVDYQSLVSAIVAAEEGYERDSLIQDLFTEARRDFALMAARFCRLFRVDRNTWADECLSIIHEIAFLMIQEAIADPKFADKIQRFLGLVQYRSKSRIAQFFESSAGTNPASGMNSMRRRRTELEKDRARMAAELGREPSRQEVVDATNERMRRQRKDAERQGMIASVADFDLHYTEDIVDHHDRAAEDDNESGKYLDRVDIQNALSKTVRLAFEVGHELGTVAQAWAFPMLSDINLDLATNQIIVEQTGMPIGKVRELRTQVDQLLIGVLGADHGINREKWIS